MIRESASHCQTGRGRPAPAARAAKRLQGRPDLRDNSIGLFGHDPLFLRRHFLAPPYAQALAHLCSSNHGCLGSAARGVHAAARPPAPAPAGRRGGHHHPGKRQSRVRPSRAAAVDTYSVAARKAMPSVVNISTSKEVKVPRHPLMDDPLFRRFFGEQLDSETQRASSLGSGVIVGHGRLHPHQQPRDRAGRRDRGFPQRRPPGAGAHRRHRSRTAISRCSRSSWRTCRPSPSARWTR